MPILGSRGSLSATKFGFLSRVVDIGAPYWIGTFTSISSSTKDSGLFVDSSKNLYILGRMADATVAKYNSSGTIQWQRQVALTRGTGILYNGSGLSSGDLLIGGVGLVSKWTSSGTISLQKELYYISSGASIISLEADGSGNLYAAGGTYASWPRALVAKYDSSGTLLWQRGFDPGTSGMQLTSSRFHNGTSSVYLSGRASSTATIVAKYSASGTVTWQRSATVSNGVGTQGGMDVDSSGNVYATFLASNGTINEMLLLKYDSSGNLSWQRTFSPPSGFELFGLGGVRVDSSGNVYASGHYYDPTNNKTLGFVVKVNSSGTTLFAREFKHSVSQVETSSWGLALDADGAFYVMARLYNTLSGYMFLKLPVTGAKTGTYTIGSYSVTYATSSLTSYTPTYTSAASSLTDSAGFQTDGTSTYSPTTPTNTSTVVTI